MPIFTIQERIVSGVAIISINGRADAHGRDDGIGRHWRRRLIEAGTVRIVLDFAEAPDIDSTALGNVSRAHATVMRRRRRAQAAARQGSCAGSCSSLRRPP